MHVQPIKTTLFRKDDALIDFIIKHIPAVQEKTIIVITSKIVALAEGRVVDKNDQQTREYWVRKESSFALRTPHVWMTIKDGMVLPGAGIDESNADGKLILLPEDSFVSADTIRTQLMKQYSVTDLGIIITDSRTLPLRAGVTGVALGYAGLQGIKDYRNKKDIFGRPFVMSRVDVADSLATAAVFVMGEGDEMQPLSIITDAHVSFVDAIDRSELTISIEDDMYGPLFKTIL